ncbi:4-hydroxy-tetrahydrodipicolinate synthase [Hylemonella gracilis]|uniref:4-hydroxy-tetrahydrodipicolinate synthase n=1 Tax=Hylemonella gracilis ATCC 19624 TaxID=887062 RepID=F3KQT4_9BURK|nr:4-hydroxy-tetrahydrodipicolinate synthase [Hylemonella gracilis]EGI77854.1 dihydrodipicolinate synthetase [Hylemonella gracilis ATCC 19624]
MPAANSNHAGAQAEANAVADQNVATTTSASARRYRGLWIPLVTPFSDGAIDLPALSQLVDHLREQGVRGFVACGSTGEAAALDADEQLAVLDTVLASAQDLPVVMGVSGYHLPKLREWLRVLASRPLAGVLTPAPLYVRPAQAGLLDWFHALADSSAAPLIVYDIPYRTGTQITTDALLTLAAHPNIQAIKDCGGDAGKTLALIADGRLDVLAGEDMQLYATLAQGGVGGITASAHLRTASFVALMNRIAEGRLDEACADWLRLVPLIQALFAEPNPGPLKAVLAGQGHLREELRAPMTPVTPALRERLRVWMDRGPCLNSEQTRRPEDGQPSSVHDASQQGATSP